MSCSAASASANRKTYPVRVRCRGTAFWPVSSISAISPNASRNTNPGVGTSAGRPQLPSQRSAEVSVCHGIGRVQVEWPSGLLVLQQKPDRPDLVRDVNPRQPLPAASQAAADEQPERQHHAGQTRRRSGSTRCQCGLPPDALPWPQLLPWRSPNPLPDLPDSRGPAARSLQHPLHHKARSSPLPRPGSEPPASTWPPRWLRLPPARR